MPTSLTKNLLIAILALAVAVSSPVQAENFFDALANGTPKLHFTLGYEHSDVDNDKDAADSLTLRTRLGYVSGEFAKTKLTLQLQNVVALVDDYAPEQPGYDVVADPEGSAVHEAYVTTTLTENMSLRLGRQEIILADARLIGNVGWRQHAQSFDALTFKAAGGNGFKFVGGYVTRVKTIFNTLADVEYLGVLDFTFSGVDGHEFGAFAYLLDAEGDLVTDRDKATYGLRAKGAFGPVEYSADYSTQDDWADAELGGGDMFNVFLAGKVGGGLKLGAGYSSISGLSGSDRPYDTLFSTAHKFNGWSDQFLGTNGGNLVGGLEDLYFQAGGVWSGHTVLARYHVFDKEAASSSYGDEIDLLWKKKVHPRVVALVKAAFYSADGENLVGPGSKDETVFWVRGIYNF